MRFKNIAYYFFLAVLACKSSVSIEPVSPTACNNPNYSKRKEIVSLDATVTSQKFFADGETTIYRLRQTTPDSQPDILAPCNLPKQFQKNDLRVRITGSFLTPLPGNTVLSVGTPIEISHIEVR